MDGREQAQPPVSSPPPAHGGGGGVMMGHASFGAAAANVMHGMSLTFNPMAAAASSPMKPSDLSGSMYHGDSGAGGGAPGMQPGGGGGGAVVGAGELMKKKRGRPRKYGPDGSIGLALKPASAASAGQSGGAGSNPDGKRKGRPPGSGKKKQLDALAGRSIQHVDERIQHESASNGEDGSKIILKFCVVSTYCNNQNPPSPSLCYCCQNLPGVPCYNTWEECQAHCPACNPKCPPEAPHLFSRLSPVT